MHHGDSMGDTTHFEVPKNLHQVDNKFWSYLFTSASRLLALVLLSPSVTATAKPFTSVQFIISSCKVTHAFSIGQHRTTSAFDIGNNHPAIVSTYLSVLSLSSIHYVQFAAPYTTKPVATCPIGVAMLDTIATVATSDAPILQNCLVGIAFKLRFYYVYYRAVCVTDSSISDIKIVLVRVSFVLILSSILACIHQLHSKEVANVIALTGFAPVLYLCSSYPEDLFA